MPTPSAARAPWTSFSTWCGLLSSLLPLSASPAGMPQTPPASALQDAEVPEQQAPSPQPLEDDDDELAGLGLGEDADEGAEPAPAGDEPDADGEQAEDGGEEEHLEREASPVADEAEEEERPSAKKRTEEQEQREMQEDVRALVGRMEQAVDEDAADVLKGEPALRKLKMLSQARADRTRAFPTSAAGICCVRWLCDRGLWCRSRRR